MPQTIFQQLTKKIKNKNVKDDYVVSIGIELFGERFN